MMMLTGTSPAAVKAEVLAWLRYHAKREETARKGVVNSLQLSRVDGRQRLLVGLIAELESTVVIADLPTEPTAELVEMMRLSAEIKTEKPK